MVHAHRAGVTALQAIVRAQGQEGRRVMPRRIESRLGTYLLSMPKAVPAGRLLVHNHVQPTRRIGSRGFRIWLALPDTPPTLQRCTCRWAPELGPHFRVASVPERVVPVAQHTATNRLGGATPERKNGA